MGWREYYFFLSNGIFLIDRLLHAHDGEHIVTV